MNAHVTSSQSGNKFPVIGSPPLRGCIFNFFFQSQRIGLKCCVLVPYLQISLMRNFLLNLYLNLAVSARVNKGQFLIRSHVKKSQLISNNHIWIINF